MNNTAIIIAVAAGILLQTPLYAVSVAAPNMAIQGTQFSANWSGYVAATDLTTPSEAVTEVEGCWIVPTIVKPPRTGDSVAFVGIGGVAAGDATLIQAGTRHQIIGGTVIYTTWYEMLPGSLMDAGVSVTAGDKVCVVIEKTPAVVPEEWRIKIDKGGDGVFEFNSVFAYESSEKTAEWIVERPSLCVISPHGPRCHLDNLANFGSITFTDAKATISGSNVPINNAPAKDDITMLSGLKTLVAVTDLVDSTDPDKFTVTYKP